MDLAEFERVADAFAAFHRRFAPLFGRMEAQRRGGQYLRGLLVQRAERRNAENLAEAVDGAAPRALQRFLTEAPWSTEPVLGRLQAEVGERLEEPDAVFVLDETGFPKQGKKSVGVARQYSGTLGKVGNCQVGVFLAYAAPAGRTFLDRELYLPKAWTEDRDRCAEAGVPDQVEFATKPVLAMRMLTRALDAGVPAGWVTGDEVYGQHYRLRAMLEERETPYVLAVPVNQRVIATVDRRVLELRADHLAAGLPPQAFKRISAGAGAKGPRLYHWARAPIRPLEDTGSGYWSGAA